jgi:plastocyanin
MRRLAVLLLVLALAAFGVAACGDDDDDGDSANTTTTETTGTTGAGGTTTGGATGEDSGGGEGKLRVAADPGGELKYTRDSLTGEAGRTEVEFENESSVPHNVAFRRDGKEVGATEVVTDDSAETTVSFEPGSYEYFCQVAGHEQAGMKGTLRVK